MTIIVKQPVTTHEPSVGKGAIGESMNKITLGAAALSAKAIYEIMQMYAEIIRLNQEQKVAMTEAQKLQSIGQADATEKAGYKYMLALCIAGAMTIGTAAIAAGATTIGSKSEKFGAGEATKEMDVVDKELKPMKSLDSVMGKEASGQSVISQNATPDDVAVKTRVAEFERGDYSNAKADEVTQKAYDHLETKDPSGVWKKAFKKALTRKLKQQGTLSSKINTQMTNVNSFNSVVNQLGQSGSSAVNGIGTALKAKEDAIASLNSSASSMSGDAIRGFAQGDADAFNSQNKEVDILSGMIQANGKNA